MALCRLGWLDSSAALLLVALLLAPVCVELDEEVVLELSLVVLELDVGGVVSLAVVEVEVEVVLEEPEPVVVLVAVLVEAVVVVVELLDSVLVVAPPAEPPGAPCAGAAALPEGDCGAAVGAGTVVVGPEATLIGGCPGCRASRVLCADAPAMAAASGPLLPADVLAASAVSGVVVLVVLVVLVVVWLVLDSGEAAPACRALLWWRSATTLERCGVVSTTVGAGGCAGGACTGAAAAGVGLRAWAGSVWC